MKAIRNPLAAAVSLLLALTLAWCTVLAPTTALAKSTPKWSSTNEWIATPTEGDYVFQLHWIDIDNLNGAKIKSVKSSNPSVARAEADSDHINITSSYKTGKTTISCKVNGVKLSHTFKVKYICPVTKFKVNGKSALKVFNKKNVYETKKTLKNKPIQVTAKKGWKITEVHKLTNGRPATKVFAGKKSWTGRVSTIKPNDGVTIVFVNSKTGAEQRIAFRKKWQLQIPNGGTVV